MSKPGKTGITRIIHAWGYSMQGLSATIKHEAAFRQELLLVITLAPAAIWITQDGIQLALLLSSLILVLIVEVLNSAIEAVVDRFGEEHHELCGRAKDMGSAAVWLVLSNLMLVWGLVLFQVYK